MANPPIDATLRSGALAHTGDALAKPAPVEPLFDSVFEQALTSDRRQATPLSRRDDHPVRRPQCEEPTNDCRDRQPYGEDGLGDPEKAPNASSQSNGVNLADADANANDNAAADADEQPSGASVDEAADTDQSDEADAQGAAEEAVEAAAVIAQADHSSELTVTTVVSAEFVDDSEPSTTEAIGGGSAQRQSSVEPSGALDLPTGELPEETATEEAAEPTKVEVPADGNGPLNDQRSDQIAEVDPTTGEEGVQDGADESDADGDVERSKQIEQNLTGGKEHAFRLAADATPSVAASNEGDASRQAENENAARIDEPHTNVETVRDGDPPTDQQTGPSHSSSKQALATATAAPAAESASRNDADETRMTNAGAEGADDRSAPQQATDRGLTALERVATSRSLQPAARTEQGPALTTVDRARFVQRVSGAIQRAQLQDGNLRVRLSPPELGSIRVEIAVRQGVLTAAIEADTTQARNVLLDNLPALRDRLAEQSIRIERFDVDVRRDGQQQPQDPGHSPDHGGRRVPNREDGARQETTRPEPAALSSIPNRIGDDALDVRI